MTNKFSLSDEGRSFLQMYVKPFEKNSLSRVQFKVDTGADLTTINKRELILLGYTYEWIESHIIADSLHTLSSAGGRAEPAYYIQMDVLNLLSLELLKWPLYIKKERNKDFPNLLGINVLTHFKFQFDYENWGFIIEGIRKPKRRLAMVSGQSLSSL